MNSISLSTKFEFDISGLRHVICVEGYAVSLIYNQIEELEYVPENLDIMHLEQLTIVDEKLDEKLNINRFNSPESLTAKLKEILSGACMGTRFYAVGSEQFVGDLRNIAFDLGMGSDEITLAVVGDRGRRVYCSTCHEINPQATSNIITCCSCGISLEVWSHFSRLKNAYLGVCADLEEV